MNCIVTACELSLYFFILFLSVFYLDFLNVAGSINATFLLITALVSGTVMVSAVVLAGIKSFTRFYLNLYESGKIMISAIQ